MRREMLSGDLVDLFQDAKEEKRNGAAGYIRWMYCKYIYTILQGL
jgi:hypothetical protein